MLFANPNACFTPYPDVLRRILDIDTARQSGAWLAHWPLIARGATPLWNLPGAAARFGIAALAVKDESLRSSLGSFKALGAPVALLRLALRLMPEARFEPQALFAGRHAEELAALTVISATDGNHGKALAAAAQSLGCACVIVLHARVSAERERAIAAHGARIVRIAGNYDESVEHAARLARRAGLACGVRYLVRRLRGDSARRDAGLRRDRGRAARAGRRAAALHARDPARRRGRPGGRHRQLSVGAFRREPPALPGGRAGPGRLPLPERHRRPPGEGFRQRRFGDGGAGLRRGLAARLAHPAALHRRVPHHRRCRCDARDASAGGRRGWRRAGAGRGIGRGRPRGAGGC